MQHGGNALSLQCCLEGLLEASFTKSHVPPQQKSTLEAHRERIEALQSKGLRPKAIYDRRRLEEPTFSGSLGAVKCLMARLTRERGPRQQAWPAQSKARDAA